MYPQVLPSIFGMSSVWAVLPAAWQADRTTTSAPQLLLACEDYAEADGSPRRLLRVTPPCTYLSLYYSMHGPQAVQIAFYKQKLSRLLQGFYRAAMTSWNIIKPRRRRRCKGFHDSG